jgi:hypothetical protein
MEHERDERAQRPVHVRVLCVRKHGRGLGGRFQCKLGGRWNLRVRNAWQRRAG